MRYAWCLVLAGLTVACASVPMPGVQQGTIVGTVRDTARRPILEAIVVIVGTTHGKVTDSLGRYRIDSVPVGVVRLTVRRIGYHPMTRDSVRVRSGHPVVVDLAMVPNERPPMPVVPTADTGR